MKLIEASIKAPVSVAVGVILVVMFGLISLRQVPVQLTPDVDSSNITVETIWPGASPQEIESEIIDVQEEQLKNIEGLVEMSSESFESRGSIVLEFKVGSDLDALMVRVANRLEQVQRYPELAEKPTLTTVDNRNNAMAWFVLRRLEGNERRSGTYRNLCLDEVVPRLERVPGIARSNVFGGSEEQMKVTVDHQKLAAMGISMLQVAAKLQQENLNISAGDMDEGKRKYIVRTTGEFRSAADINEVVLAYQNGQAVRLKDVGGATLGYQDEDYLVRHFGAESIAVNCIRSSGANVLQTMTDLQAAVEELNDGLLKAQGLQLHQVYDETTYIYSALSLVKQNMIIGGILATVILFVFLRSAGSVCVIAIAIPISIVGTFLAMYAVGRNVNVISLAGMSFAIGMVVDNSIVVLENIFRHKEMGMPGRKAALVGAREVWGAVLASTLTTMAVFVPVLFMEEEVGQLFRDIAIAISAAVAFSMLVSLTVIPALTARMKHTIKAKGTNPLDRLGQAFSNRVSALVYSVCGSMRSRLLVSILLPALALLIAWKIIPPAEYLPQGNRNLAFGILIPPAGYNLNELQAIGHELEDKLSKHFPMYQEKPTESQAAPHFANFFFVARGQSVFMGAVAEDPAEIGQVVSVMQQALADIPGMIAIVTQSSLFGRSIGEGRSVDVEITGPDLEKLMAVAGRNFGMLMGVMPQGTQMRPIPGLDLGNPEVTIIPDRNLAARVGLSTREIGVTVDTILDGRKIDDYTHKGEDIDLILEGDQSHIPLTQDIASLPVGVWQGEPVLLGSVAVVKPGSGPQQVNHLERKRSVVINVVPDKNLPLEETIRLIKENVITPQVDEGSIGGLYNISLAGTADKLNVTAESLKWRLLLAVAISYLLMSALFESFLYPLVIMISVPLAAVGGLAGLLLVNVALVSQPMDTLTMLGFFILIGTVVNNAILIVHQSLNLLKEGQGLREAIRDAVQTRIRPIFMSTLTSMLGMLPLVLFPGAGSELYRGIGSVVIGGLLISTLFTLVLVPALFSLVYSLRQRVLSAVKEVAA